MAMKNLVGYVETYRHTLDEMPFTEVDSLVLSQLAYLQLDSCGLMTPDRALYLGELAAHREDRALLVNVTSKSKTRELLCGLTQSPRFRDVRITGYVDQVDPQTQKQFSATMYLLEDGTAYIAFRGTDSTMVAWRENLSLALLSATPSQQESIPYLESAAAGLPGPIRLGGQRRTLYHQTRGDPGLPGRRCRVQCLGGESGNPRERADHQSAH